MSLEFSLRNNLSKDEMIIALKQLSYFANFKKQKKEVKENCLGCLHYILVINNVFVVCKETGNILTTIPEFKCEFFKNK